jgi:hypothetical protein
MFFGCLFGGWRHKKHLKVSSQNNLLPPGDYLYIYSNLTMVVAGRMMANVWTGGDFSPFVLEKFLL